MESGLAALCGKYYEEVTVKALNDSPESEVAGIIPEDKSSQT